MKIPAAGRLVAILMAAKAATKAKVAARLAAAKKSADDELAKLGAGAAKFYEVAYDFKMVLVVGSLVGSLVGGVSLATNVTQMFDRDATSLHYRTMEDRVSSIERILNKPRSEYIGIAIVIAPPDANGDQNPLILSAQRSLVDESRAVKQEQEHGWRVITQLQLLPKHKIEGAQK